MPEVDDFHGPERRDEGHDLWVAMKAAYAAYIGATEDVESTRESPHDPHSERLKLTLLAARHRSALERYLEARMEFLEFRFDECNRAGAQLTTPPKSDTELSRIRRWVAFVNSRAVLETLAVLLLCTISFSLAREKQHVRGLEAGRKELRATLDQTREGLRLLELRLNTSKRLQNSATVSAKPVLRAPLQQNPGATTQRSARKSGGQGRLPATLQSRQSKTSPNLAPPKGASQSIRWRNYYSLSLALSLQFKRVGPIDVLLRSVDARRQSAILSIGAGVFKNDYRVELNQPLRIHVGHDDAVVELVADRISGNRLDGHLTETWTEKADLRTDRLTPRSPATAAVRP